MIGGHEEIGGISSHDFGSNSNEYYFPDQHKSASDNRIISYETVV